jgi:uncharacterized protein YjiS (DUF1127 family)
MFAMGRFRIFSIWCERVSHRQALGEMLAANPHLIDDIGMTKREAEEEITKRFWQK